MASTSINSQNMYTVNIHGLKAIFSTHTELEPQQLQKFLQHRAEKPKHRTQKDVASLNTDFVDLMMDKVIPILHYYDSSIRNHELEFTDDTQNQSNLPFSFKVASKNRETVFDRHWREHFQEVVEFKSKFGHPNVSRTTPGYDQLGNWLSDQRKKLRRGKMTKEQYDMLTELGWFIGYQLLTKQA